MTSPRVSTDRPRAQQARQSFGAGRPSPLESSSSIPVNKVPVEEALQNQTISDIFISLSGIVKELETIEDQWKNPKFSDTQGQLIDAPRPKPAIFEPIQLETQKKLQKSATYFSALKTAFEAHPLEHIFTTIGDKKRMQTEIKKFDILSSVDESQDVKTVFKQQEGGLIDFLAFLKSKIDPVRECEEKLEAYAHDSKAVEITDKIKQARKFAVNPSDPISVLRSINSYFGKPTPQGFSRTEFMKLPTNQQIAGLIELNDAFKQGEAYIRTAR